MNKLDKTLGLIFMLVGYVVVTFGFYILLQLLF